MGLAPDLYRTNKSVQCLPRKSSRRRRPVKNRFLDDNVKLDSNHSLEDKESRRPKVRKIPEITLSEKIPNKQELECLTRLLKEIQRQRFLTFSEKIPNKQKLECLTRFRKEIQRRQFLTLFEKIPSKQKLECLTRFKEIQRQKSLALSGVPHGIKVLKVHKREFNFTGLPEEIRFSIYDKLLYAERVIYIYPLRTHKHVLNSMLQVSRKIRFDIKRKYLPEVEKNGDLVRSRIFDWLYPENTVFYMPPLKGIELEHEHSYSWREIPESLRIQMEIRTSTHPFYAIWLFEAMQEVLNSSLGIETLNFELHLCNVLPMRLDLRHGFLSCLRPYWRKVAELGPGNYIGLTHGGIGEMPWSLRRMVL